MAGMQFLVRKYCIFLLEEISKHIGDKNVIQVGQLIYHFHNTIGEEPEECSDSTDEAEEVAPSIILQESAAVSFIPPHSSTFSIPYLSSTSTTSPEQISQAERKEDLQLAEKEAEKYNIPLLNELLFHMWVVTCYLF